MLPFSFFKSKPKSPAELVRSFKEARYRLDSVDPKAQEKAVEECTKYLAALKHMTSIDTAGKDKHCLFPTYVVVGNETNPETFSQLAQEAYVNELLELLVSHLGRFAFEARKDAVVLFNALVRRPVGSRTPTVEYICAHPALIAELLRGYERQELALNYGMMLRECLKHEALAQLCLGLPECDLLFDYVQMPTFDIASDAFATLKVDFLSLID